MRHDDAVAVGRVRGLGIEIRAPVEHDQRVECRQAATGVAATGERSQANNVRTDAGTLLDEVTHELGRELRSIETDGHDSHRRGENDGRGNSSAPRVMQRRDGSGFLRQSSTGPEMNSKRGMMSRLKISSSPRRHRIASSRHSARRASMPSISMPRAPPRAKGLRISMPLTR